jgi:hypothetical protein
VASVQTLLESTGEEALAGRTFDCLVFEECSHYRATEWERVREQYAPAARLLGLTAFPKRYDGRGKMFESMVVAANYSELVNSGCLADCRLWRPAQSLGRDLAMDPVSAWLKYAECSKTFAFVPRIEIAPFCVAKLRLPGARACVGSQSAADCSCRSSSTMRSDRVGSGAGRVILGRRA